MITLFQIQRFVHEGRYFFSTHALIEARKDGVEPEDIVTVLLIGEIIESYPERKRVLIYGRMVDKIPLHVICDCTTENVIVIPTVYIPNVNQEEKDEHTLCMS